MEGKVFLATYGDGTKKVLGDGAALEDRLFVEGEWVEFGDPRIRDAAWEAWEAEEIIDRP